MKTKTAEITILAAMWHQINDYYIF